MDIAKYLFFAEPSRVDLTFAYHVGKANEYLDALKNHGLRAAGILGKLLRLQNLLSFLETAIEDDGHTPGSANATRCPRQDLTNEAEAEGVAHAFPKAQKPGTYKSYIGEPPLGVLGWVRVRVIAVHSAWLFGTGC